ncbi:hypothetical protein [Flavobacterium sangjuense]|uniref:Uncharacterized protein n=1 Tax=Flavobacterium sangjuense TaxID=2518177 RepID=A0A4P7PV31_9FLAO|nr:hypothetical protein [Flavobacterium sangjuense]QBZ98847.1 hypothetical protein GS03_02358 [Flavobacterium sangjuense]
MNEYDQFINLFLNALNNVEQEYFETQYNQFYALRERLKTYGRFRGQLFIRHSERGFAYELYFQLRKLIDDHREKEDFFSGFFLQGEIKKMDLPEVRNIYGYDSIGGNLIPDLLFHMPSQDANAFVVEIKAQPELEEVEILDDLEKLSKFLRNFNYRKAIFLAVNIDTEIVNGFIRNNQVLLTEMFTEERLNDCNVITLQNAYSDNITNTTLQQILNE